MGASVLNYFEQATAAGDNKLNLGGTADITGTLQRHGASVGDALTYTKAIRITLAELNAGYELVAAVTGKSIRVVNYYLRIIGGAATAATDVRIQDDEGTPVVVVTAAVAALTEDIEISGQNTVANVTKGAGWMALLTAGQALDIVKTGATMTTLSHVDVIVQYQIG